MRLFVAVVFLATILAINAEIPKLSSVRLFNETEEPDASLHRGVFLTRQDHSRPQNLHVDNFTYFANLEFAQPNAPFYIYIKDARDYTTRWIESSLMVDIAEETNASLFTFDLRYFGNNVVTQNATFENLQFLTFEQILSDIATFITEMKILHHGLESEVILYGSGLGATLAAWARKKYPHLVDAVWSSSGIFEIEQYTYAPIDLLEFTLLDAGLPQCHDRFQLAFEELDELLANNNGAEIQKLFSLCHPVDTTSAVDIASFYEYYVNFVINYLQLHHTHGVRHFCEDLQSFPSDALGSFARWAKHVHAHDLQCFDHTYKNRIERNANTAWNQIGTSSGSRQLIYLQCTQFGLFPLTHNESFLPDRLPRSYYEQKCQDIFGEQYNPLAFLVANLALVNEFGSINQHITRVIYTNGDIDPWLYNGLLATSSWNATVVTILHHAKSSDLPEATGYDSEALVAAKNSVRRNILFWSS